MIIWIIAINNVIMADFFGFKITTSTKQKVTYANTTPVRSIKKKSTDLESTGENVLSLASGLSLNLVRGGREGDETEMSFSKAFVPLLSSP